MPFRVYGIILSVSLSLVAVAYYKRDELLLGIIKHRSANEFSIAGPRTLQWARGLEEAETDVNVRAPNVVLIVADDLGYNDISTFGGGVASGKVRTPNIDALAAEGASFVNSYSGAGTCAPSRAMLMTGRYPTRTGFNFTPMPSGMGKMVSRLAERSGTGLPPVLFDTAAEDSKPPYQLQGLPAEEVTVAELMREAGYHTVHIGKWHLGRQNGMAPHEQGFNESLLMTSGLYLPEEHPDVVNAKLDFDPIDRFLWARMTFANSYNSGNDDAFEPGGYLTDYWTDEAVKVIEANRNRPFFLYLAHWGVHTPLQATREDYEAVGEITPHRLRVYAAMIRALDRSVGRVVDALDAYGLGNNTIVMFTSDNGGPGYLGLPDINTPFRGWKITQFEGGIRVPLLVRWPASVRRGTSIDAPSAHIDVMPTLLAATGIQLPEDLEIDGVNLTPVLEGGQQPALVDRPLFWQAGHYKAVRSGQWKLQVADRPQKRWLFNLAEDPGETQNLADSNPAKVGELLSLLHDHLEGARDPLYQATLDAPVAIDKTLADTFDSTDEWVSVPN